MDAALKIGIVIADDEEYKPLARFIENGEYEKYGVLNRTGHKFTVKTEKGEAQVISVLCGIGKVNAAAAAMHLIDCGCDILLNYGLSGGISGISRNELCVCSRFLEHDFDLTGIGYKPCEKPGQDYIYNADAVLMRLFGNLCDCAKTGTAVSGDSFVCDESLRNVLKEKFSAMCCDMETAAIAYVCAYSDVPFFSLRRISDDAGETAADAYRETNTDNQTLLSDYILEFIKVIINSNLFGRSA